MTPQQVEIRIRENFPDAEVVVKDLTGGGDHYDIVVVSKAFDGKRLLQQHQAVYACFPELKSGEVHAMKLKTSAPKS